MTASRSESRLAALQREQREIGRDDDQGRKEDRPRHLAGRGSDVLLGQFLGRLRLAPPQNVLGHHDRAVDDHAEIEGAERQHARGHVGGIHQHEDGDHGQRYGHGDDQRATRAAEEQYEDDNHQADAFEQRVADLAHGRGDEIAAVENRNDVNVLGLELLAQLLHLGGGCRQ